MGSSRYPPLAAFMLLPLACGETQAEPGRDASRPTDASSSAVQDAAHDARREAAVAIDASVPTDGTPPRGDAGAPHDGGSPPLEASILDSGADVVSPPAGCTASCATEDDCTTTCEPAFLTSFCCDLTSHQCFVNESGGPCPIHAAACPDAGCPAGQMCVQYTGPETFGIPSCYPLPAACATNPTCPCLADADVCGAVEQGPFPCADGGGAFIWCSVF